MHVAFKAYAIVAKGQFFFPNTSKLMPLAFFVYYCSSGTAAAPLWLSCSHHAASDECPALICLSKSKQARHAGDGRAGKGEAKAMCPNALWQAAGRGRVWGRRS